MKKLVLLFTVIASILLWSCGNSDSNKGTTAKKTEQSKKEIEKKETKLPEGYPAELTVPPGFKASQIGDGNGTGNRTITKNGKISFGKTQTYKSYEIWKMNPQNAPELISFYKKLLTDLNYTGEWSGDGIKSSARGTFIKGKNELKLSISSEQFKFNLKVWEK